MKLQTVLFSFFFQILRFEIGVQLIYGCGLYTDVYSKYILLDIYISFNLNCNVTNDVMQILKCVSYWSMINQTTRVRKLK